MSDIDADSAKLAVEGYLRYLERGGTPLSLHGLSDEESSELSGVFRLLDACWGADSFQVPALEDDPLAAELGIRAKPSPLISIRGSAVKTARSRSGLTIRRVASTLSGLGHPVTTAWVFDLEQKTEQEVGAELAEALARVLGVQSTELLSHHSGIVDGIKVFLDSPSFGGIVERFAWLRGLDPGQVRTRAEFQLANAPRRSRGEPDQDEWKRLLITLLETWD